MQKQQAVLIAAVMLAIPVESGPSLIEDFADPFYMFA